MTPWLRFTFRVAPLPLLLAAVVLLYGATASHGAGPTPTASATRSPSPSSSPSASPSRAGSRAGEGRQRPGRPEAPAVEFEGDDDTTSVPQDTAREDPDPQDEAGDEPRDEAGDTQEPPDGGADTATASQSPGDAGLVPSSPSSRPGGRTVAGGEDTVEPLVRILPLGSGLVLIGLGLGLGLLGLRVRRD